MTNDKDSEVLAELLGTMRERCTDPCRSEKAELGCDCDAARRAAVMLRQPAQSDALKMAREALEGLIDHCVEQERVITEEMHHVDYCGESAPICAARAALEQSK
jgi:hypothetical protein